MSQFSCHESRGGCILFTEFLLRKCKKSIPSIYINYVKRKSRLNQYYCCFRVPRMDHGYDLFFLLFFFLHTMGVLSVRRSTRLLDKKKKYLILFAKSIFLVSSRWEVSPLFCYSRYPHYLFLLSISFWLQYFPKTIFSPLHDQRNSQEQLGLTQSGQSLWT